MEAIYLTVWSGGYESPQIKAAATLKEAIKVRTAWSKDADDDDMVDVVKIDLSTLTAVYC
jgi:hypothetical protein